jgi:thioredoxin-related protein
MHKITRVIAATLLFVCGCAAPAPQPLRNVFSLSDIETELGKATQEHKSLLIKFVGSSWCLPCHRLEKNVFETAAFRRASENFRIVTADYPPPEGRTEEKTRSDPALAKLMEIKQRYDVPGFPTTIVLSADGTVRTRIVGHSSDSAGAYIARLASK